MALFSVEIADDKVLDVVDALCNVYNYQESSGLTKFAFATKTGYSPKNPNKTN
jgi:hypothetical protein